METLSEMGGRHDQEMKELMKQQLVTWQALNDQYGRGNIPDDAYKQWDQQYGNAPLHSLRAQHLAELESFPVSPYEQLYQTADEQHPLPVIEQQPTEQKQNDKLFPVTTPRREEDIFAELIEREKQKEKDLEQGIMPGIDPDR
jgi:hypothetical protein